MQAAKKLSDEIAAKQKQAESTEAAIDRARTVHVFLCGSGVGVGVGAGGEGGVGYGCMGLDVVVSMSADVGVGVVCGCVQV